MPRSLEAGKYRVVISTDQRRLSESSTWRSARVAPAASAAAAPIGAMTRHP